VSCCFGCSGPRYLRLLAVLANLGPYMCCGGSCACPEVVSRVVVRALMPGRHPYASLRVRLTRHLELYSSRPCRVLSAQALTVLGMALQCPRWRHNTGDGHTAPDVTEEMRPASLTSQRHPGQAPSLWSYVSRGRRCPFLRGHRPSRTGPAEHQVRLGSIGLVEQRREQIPRPCQGIAVVGIPL
jgi:hypothetical protein